MQDRKALDALLVRWHRWSADPSASADAAMRDLDQSIGHLSPCFIAALIVEARNLSCGAVVWRNVRAGGKRNHQKARHALLRKLAPDQIRWFGATVVMLSARGNRVGESNPSAKVPDRDVELCVQMREQTDNTGKPLYSLGQLALRFKVPKSTVQAWCDGNRRGQAAARVLRVREA